MNFVLTDKHTTNTDLTGPDGRVIYHVETPWKLISKNTRVMRATGEKSGSQIVGAIDWHSFGNTDVLVNGRRVDLQGCGIFSQ